MDVFDTRYYKINKFILSCIGQWVYQPAGKKRLARIFIFLSLFTALVPQFNFLFSVWGNVDETLECLPPLILVITCFCQVGIFMYNEKKLLSLANSIRKDWKFWLSGRELEILQKHSETGRFFTLLYAINVYASVFTFVSMSLTPIVLDIWIPLNKTRPKQLVYAAKFPFDEDKNFQWILIHGALTAFYNLSVLFSCEAMLAVTTQHVCGLFSIISYRLKKIMQLSQDKNRSSGQYINELIYKEMASSVEWHNQALGYAKILDSCFSPILFFTVGLNVIIISLLGIQTLNSTDSLAKTIKFGAFTSACLVHLFCISLPAQNLLNSSTEVADAAYGSDWYQMPIKSKRLLILLIQRGQIPCKLTAGKIFTMDMVTFSGLLKTSLSYFTVLLSLR